MELKHTVKCPLCGGSGKREVINGTALRKIRESQAISLRAMAKAVGVSAPYISDIERGNRNCTPEILKCYEKLP